MKWGREPYPCVRAEKLRDDVRAAPFPDKKRATCRGRSERTPFMGDDPRRPASTEEP